MKYIDSADYEHDNRTETQWSSTKTSFYVETENATYRAHDLDTAMKLWAAHADETKVVAVGSFG